MNIKSTPIASQTIRDLSKGQIANSGIKTDDNIVTNEQGQINQADLEGAMQADDKILLQKETGGDEFVEIDLSKPENRQIVNQLLADLESGQDVSLDASITTLFEPEITDPNPEINLKDGQNTEADLEQMGVNIKDGISETEGQAIITKLQAEGATEPEIQAVQQQVQDKLADNQKLKLGMNAETGEYNFKASSSEQEKISNGKLKVTKGQRVHVTRPKTITLFGGRSKKLRCGLNPPRPVKIKIPGISFRERSVNWRPPLHKTQTDQVSGVTGPSKQEKVENVSFQLKKTAIPEPYEFDFPNLYDNNRTAIEKEDKPVFKEKTAQDNDIFAKIADGNPDLDIVIKADGSRNVDRKDWKTAYTSDELQGQRSIKGSYSHQDNQFQIHGTASASPGSGTYRDIDVPPFARDSVVPGEDKVHNDTLSLFRSVNAYIEFVNNADPETQAAVKDKKVSFEIHPQVAENLPPELLAKFEAGMSWTEMNSLPSLAEPVQDEPVQTQTETESNQSTSSGNTSVSGTNRSGPAANARNKPAPLVDGYHKTYNANGDIESTGTFKDGQLIDGRKYIYDSDQLLDRIEVFKDGEYFGPGQIASF